MTEELKAPFEIEGNLAPLLNGDGGWPYMEPIPKTLDDYKAILNYFTHPMMQIMRGYIKYEDNKRKEALYFLDTTQLGRLNGFAYVVVSDIGKASLVKVFACKHQSVEGAGADHIRGWHPAHCSKCGLDMTVDSSD